jgi:type II secretory pathway component PulF
MRPARPQTRSLAIAQLSRNLADLLDADFTPAASLRLASSALQRPPLKRAAGRVADSLQSPANLLTDAERRTVTSSVLFALQSDLPRRARSAVLREIGHCHEERARESLWWARGTLEPIAIVVVGFAVALTVIALYLPLFGLIHSLTS